MQDQQQPVLPRSGMEDQARLGQAFRRAAAAPTAVTTGGRRAREVEEQETGQGASEGMQPQAVFGYCVVRALEDTGKRKDYVVAQMKHVEAEDGEQHEVAFFGVFDDHGGGSVGRQLKATLLDNILAEGGVWSDPAGATRDAYLLTDRQLLQRRHCPPGSGATAVTAMLLHGGARLLVANLGDSRAVLSKNGQALQLSIDHTPSRPLERANVEMRGGVVTTMPGDIPRVDGLLGVARAFGDASLKEHMSSKPDVCDLVVDISLEFLILGSNGLWSAFPTNQEVVDMARDIPDPLIAARCLTREARKRGSGDEISCIVVRFREL